MLAFVLGVPIAVSRLSVVLPLNVFVVLALLGVAASPGAHATAYLDADGVTSLRTAVESAHVVVTLRCRTWDTTELIGNAEEYLHAYGESVVAIQDLNITFGGKRLFVPRSAYADLLDVRRAELRPRGATAELVIAGSDASAGYEVTLEFDGSRVRRRSLSPTMARGKASEETRYHVVTIPDGEPGR